MKKIPKPAKTTSLVKARTGSNTWTEANRAIKDRPDVSPVEIRVQSPEDKLRLELQRQARARRQATSSPFAKRVAGATDRVT